MGGCYKRSCSCIKNKCVRTTPTGVAIKGVISITIKWHLKDKKLGSNRDGIRDDKMSSRVLG